MGIPTQALAGMINYIALCCAMLLLIYVLISILGSPITFSNMGPGTDRVVHLYEVYQLRIVDIPVSLIELASETRFLTVKYSIQLLACLLRHGSLITGIILCDIITYDVIISVTVSPI